MEVISFDAINGHNLFQTSAQIDPQTSQIIFLRGWQSSEWLRVLGAQCGIDPEFFRRHLDFVRYTEHHDLPALPSSNHNIWRLRITTICHRQVDGSEDIERSRESDFGVVEKYQRDLRAKGTIGSSIVRRYAIHDETVSTIEQDISISVRQKRKGGWTGEY